MLNVRKDYLKSLLRSKSELSPSAEKRSIYQLPTVLSSPESWCLWWFQPCLFSGVGAGDQSTKILHICQWVQWKGIWILLLITFLFPSFSCMCVFMQKPERIVHLLPLVCLIHLRQDVTVNLQLTISAKLAAHWALNICLTLPQCWGYKDTQHLSICGLCRSAGDLNSSLHASWQMLLPIGPFPQPFFLFLMFTEKTFFGGSKCLKKWPDYLAQPWVSIAFWYSYISKLSADDILHFHLHSV